MEGFLHEGETDIMEQKRLEAEKRAKMLADGYVRLLVLDDSNDLVHRWVKLDPDSRRALEDAKQKRLLVSKEAAIRAREERLSVRDQYARLEEREQKLLERERALEAKHKTQGSKPKARS